MKKILQCALMMVCIVANASAQEQSETGRTSNMCQYMPVTHWSLSIKGGANYFRVAPSATKQLDQINPVYGGTLEYSINPLVGIGLEYSHNDYSHSYYRQPLNGDLNGYAHDATLYGSINLANLLIPYRPGNWSRMNIYGNGGVGVSFYHYDLDHGNISSDNLSTDPISALAHVGINLEYNLNRSFAWGIEGQYRYYDRSTMGGLTASKGYCDALVATMSLRFKFGATGNKKHARNISICEYYPQPAPIILSKIVKDNTQSTLDRLNKVEEDNASLKREMQKMANDAKNSPIEKTLLTQNSTLQQKLLKMEDDLKDLATKKEGVVNASFETIEFRTGSSELTPASTEILNQISGILKNNSFWSGIKVYGHTDSVGASSYNQKLSESRALSVKNYIMSKGIPTSNIIAVGMGENKPIATNNTPEGRQNNRRVEFEITK
jgi:Outer membrane protein and related peptidoglycan-associated (lipo)proteins